MGTNDKYVKLAINPGNAFFPQEVKQPMSLGDLLIELEYAIKVHGEDALVVLHDEGQAGLVRRWGRIEVGEGDYLFTEIEKEEL